MADPEYKFKFYTRKNKITGQKEHQTLMMADVDGKPVTYRSSFQSSKDKARSEINRAIGLVKASKTGKPVTVKQSYGTRRVQMNPSKDVQSILSTGGKITPPETYADTSYKDGRKVTQVRSQTGVRKGPRTTSVAANMLSQDYDPFTDETKKSLLSKKMIR